MADNGHGTVALFNARTTKRSGLTGGHRVYGAGGSHLHAGWDLTGSRVEFTSHKLGDPNVCVGIVPGGWKGVGFSPIVPQSPEMPKLILGMRQKETALDSRTGCTDIGGVLAKQKPFDYKEQ